MKKLILLLFIPLVFTCSSDSDNDSQQDNNNFDNYPKLISFTRETANDSCEGLDWSVELSYSDDKIISSQTRVYHYYLGGECVYYGEDGFISNSINNVYSGDLLISQRVFMYNSDGTFDDSNFHLYEYDEEGLLNKWIIQRLDNNNVITEIGAVLAELGRQPIRARKFLIDYQDRVLFGKDAYNISEYFVYFRVLETSDEYFDYYRKRHAHWKMYGLSLPDSVLKKIYYKNALRILPSINKNLFE